MLIGAIVWSIVRVGPEWMDLELFTFARSWPNPELVEGNIYFRSSPLGPLVTGSYSPAM